MAHPAAAQLPAPVISGADSMTIWSASPARYDAEYDPYYGVVTYMSVDEVRSRIQNAYGIALSRIRPTGFSWKWVTAALSVR